MNDFTKSELEYLLWSINYTKSKTTNCSDALSLLRTKITGMIDSYCEHKFEGQCYSCAVEECTKCNKVRWGC